MTDIPDCFYRVSIKALVQDEKGRFLLIREEKGWELPGGGLDFGENPTEGLARELSEEMGLVLSEMDSSPSYFYTWDELGIWRSNVVYKVKLESLSFKKSKECLEIRFFTKEEARKEKLFPNVEKFIELYS